MKKPDILNEHEADSWPNSTPIRVTPLDPDFIKDMEFAADMISAAAPIDAYPGTVMTPLRVAATYNIPESRGAGQKIGVLSFGGGWLQSDLDASLAILGMPPVSVTTILLEGATGAFTNDASSAENLLDLYCVAAMVPDADITLYITGGSGVLAWANMLQRTIDDGCDVVSISWNRTETRTAVEMIGPVLQQAADAGISVFCSSGDWGSTPAGGSSPALYISYPSGDPNVVSVGGTALWMDPVSNTRVIEEAWNSGTTISGGGISDYNMIDYSKPDPLAAPPLVPTWQAGLKFYYWFYSTGRDATAYDLYGRGAPDIAAAATNYILVFNGQTSYVAGTSASAPVMAGAMARYRKILNKKFSAMDLHLAFYPNQQAFYDLTTGNGTSATYPTGYAVIAGWDPVTGQGAMQGDEILKLLSDLTIGPGISIGGGITFS